MASQLKKSYNSLLISEVPAYGNKFLYSLGFLSAISFLLLIISGTIMALYGPGYWLTNSFGKYLRSVHMWSTQAFVVFIILHLIIVFFSGAFKKPRRLTWIIGVLMLLLVLAETEFGFVLRGDFSSQWRALQGADFYNGSGLGYWLNPLNYKQIYGVHIVLVPLLIIGLLLGHYFLVHANGIAYPFKKNVKVKSVQADHRLLFIRGGVLVLLILGLALILPSPYLEPTSISQVATTDPAVIAVTLTQEFDATSGTATYVDNIAPYTFNTRKIYIDGPYNALLATNSVGSINQLAVFNSEPADTQGAQLKDAESFYGSWNGTSSINSPNPAIQVVASLVRMASAGLYDPYLARENTLATSGDNTTYVARFLSDSGVLDDKATALDLTTDQYGMLHEEAAHVPGAWWLAPIGLLNHTVLKNDANGDRDAGIIFGTFFLLLLAWPFIPILNRIPDWLGIYKLIWRTKRS